MTRCEDYPCCGHTDGLGCNWTYTNQAQAYDIDHAMCDHENGFCDHEDLWSVDRDDLFCGNCERAYDDDEIRSSGFTHECAPEPVPMTYNPTTGQWNEIPLL